MKTLRYSKCLRVHCLLTYVLLLLVISGCSFNVTRYTDGPLTQYLTEPVPTLNKPIARTLSVEKIMYNTAGSMKATMISDLVSREIYLMPNEVGIEVKKQLNMDNEFSKKATYAGLNTLARNRAKARHMWEGSAKGTQITTTSSYTGSQYIKRHESMAKAAYDKGDYMTGNIHNAAAESYLRGQHAAERTQAVANLTFSYLNAMAAAGEALIKNDFIKLRNWIEFDSGAIGKRAPKGNHLSIFFLQFFDAESFQLDSRNRVAVFMVLTNKKGVSSSVLEGSDILNCEGECNLFKPKPTAKIFKYTATSADVQKILTVKGLENMENNGFDRVSGFYQYILLQHGLQKLSKAL